MGCNSSKSEIPAVGKSVRNSHDLKEASKSRHHYQKHAEAPKVDDKGHLLPEEVQKRIVGSTVVQTAFVGTDEDQPITEIQYAYLTQRGYYPTSKFGYYCWCCHMMSSHDNPVCFSFAICTVSIYASTYY